MMSYVQGHQGHILALFVQHVRLAGAALGIALLIALPVGIAISRSGRLSSHVYGPIMGVLGAVYTIPSLALLALLVVYVGIGSTPALIALVAYAQFILVRNIVTGLRGVDRVVVEAARGMGMSAAQVLWRVELPLALPVIVAGVRIATVTIIGIATVAAYIDGGGLGVLLFEGVNQGYNEEIEAGVVAIAALALLADLLLRLIEWAAARHTGGAGASGAARQR